MQNTIRTENGTQADQIIHMSRTKPNKNFGMIWNKICRENTQALVAASRRGKHSQLSSGYDSKENQKLT